MVCLIVINEWAHILWIMEECVGEKSFCIGETSLEGIDVYKPAWILDIVQLGYLVGYKKYLVEAFSGFVSKV